MCRQTVKKMHGLKHGKNVPQRGLYCIFTLMITLVISSCTSATGGWRNPFAPIEMREKIDDETVRQYAAEWKEIKPSVERLASLEGDLSEFLHNVNQMTELGSTPGLNPTEDATQMDTAETPAAQDKDTPIPPAVTNPAEQNSFGIAPMPIGNFYATYQAPDLEETPPQLCAHPSNNNYRKSLGVMARFPRMTPDTSTVGALESVEEHLPILLANHLNTHHALLPPLQLRTGFTTSTQIQTIARKNRLQFIISGEVDDLSLAYPEADPAPGLFTRALTGVHDVLNFRSPLDRRDRAFRFQIHLYDGITGQPILAKQYKTSGKWSLPRDQKIGFASAQFWHTDYGQQVKALVGQASQDLAQLLDCQPFMAVVDTQPGDSQVVIHGGKNSGLQAGDTLEFYKILTLPMPGDSRQVVTRLIKQDSSVYVTEAYPAHSLAQVAFAQNITGQYLVKAP